MTTVIDKTNGKLAEMVAEVSNRRGATGTVAAGPAGAKPPLAPTLSGSVEQAREAVAHAVESMRRAEMMLADTAARLSYEMDLVFSVYEASRAGGAPVNVEEARKRAEAEADARHARQPTDPETIKEMMAEAPPILAPQGWSCPDHGKVVQKHSNRTGKDYLACPVEGCIEIERR